MNMYYIKERTDRLAVVLSFAFEILTCPKIATEINFHNSLP